MKNNVLAIIGKELARFFGDKRLLLSTVLLPGVMIYVLYSFMGSALNGMTTPDEGYKYEICAVNMPASLAPMLTDDSFDFAEINAGDIETRKSEVGEKGLDLLAVFPEDFDERLAAFDPASGETAPQVELYYNSTRTESSTAYGMVSSVLGEFERALANKFDVNFGGEGFDLASEKDASGFMFSSMLPMLLMIFLFTGCQAVAPEAIAGEKERGTIATMLITPMKRSELAIGKIVALAIIALLAGASSTLGTLLSLPKLMGGTSENLTAVFYGPSDYALLAAVILSTVLLMISVISVISAYAKTIKEAQTSVMPLMVVVMLVGVTAMFSGEAQGAMQYYFIPLYNSVQCMVGIFAFNAAGSHILITVAVNLVLSVACGFALTKMFNSEKIMFKR